MKIMKHLILLSSLLFLTSCGAMHKDCLSLIGDRDAYRYCSANQGNQVSQFELGVAAFDAEDYDTAISWLKRAARTKAPEGRSYLDPQAKSRRDLIFPEDVKLILPGHQASQRLLAKIYEEGIGVPIDLKQARRYREMINPL
ncbi:MAG: sel1 repeat family protein [Emcibacteraceae bacterium]|nr:sel1 repeat family protein [Emcibacteraceae bacterium]